MNKGLASENCGGNGAGGTNLKLQTILYLTEYTEITEITENTENTKNTLIPIFILMHLKEMMRLLKFSERQTK